MDALRGSWPEVAAAKESAVPWEALLAQFMGGVRRSDYRTYPFNRKHIHRGLYLPTLGAPGPQAMITVLDTSGSIRRPGRESLPGRGGPPTRGERVPADRAAGGCEGPVEPRTTSRGTSHRTRGTGRADQILGRGGTDFRPAFEWVLTRPRKRD